MRASVQFESRLLTSALVLSSAVVASRGDRSMGDDGAARTRAACPVNALGADDGVRFNGNRRQENRSQHSGENSLHDIKPSVVLTGWRRPGPPKAARR